MHNVLWTGGWDSTFRVADLVVSHGRTVSPFYIFDPARKSSALEVKRIKEIADLLRDASGEIKSLTVVDLAAIPPDPKPSQQLAELAAKGHIGIQYEWIARAAAMWGVKDLELSIHRDDKAHAFLEESVLRTGSGADETWRLDPGTPADSPLQLFSRLSFPVFETTKIEMRDRAVANGFSQAMERTWFCHTPRGERTCGICNPCVYTREEGLGDRVHNPSSLDRLIYRGSKARAAIIRRLTARR